MFPLSPWRAFLMPQLKAVTFAIIVCMFNHVVFKKKKKENILPQQVQWWGNGYIVMHVIIICFIDRECSIFSLLAGSLGPIYKHGTLYGHNTNLGLGEGGIWDNQWINWLLKILNQKWDSRVKTLLLIESRLACGLKNNNVTSSCTTQHWYDNRDQNIRALWIKELHVIFPLCQSSKFENTEANSSLLEML